jgi:tetratricopeptide (TPR) repeat protein
MTDAREPGADDDVWMHVARVSELNSKGRHDLALQYAQKGRARFPDDPDLGFHMAVALYGLKRRDEAEAVAREAVGNDADGTSGALVFLGVLLMDKGRHRESEQCFLDALRNDPEHAFAWQQYGKLMARVGRFDKARELVARARSLDPEDADTLSLLAEIERDAEAGLRPQAEADRRAEKVSRAALGKAPDDPTQLVQHAISCLTRGRPFTARRLLREALTAQPSEGLEEAWLEADKVCRWTFQPVYWLNMLARLLPGGASTLWMLFAGYGVLIRSLKVATPIAFAPIAVFVPLALYSWIAEPVTRLWIRLVPPR